EGMSVDTLIAQTLSPGVEPLTLMSGRVDGCLGPVLSYRGPLQRRGVETNPYNVYLDLFVGSADVSPDVIKQLVDQRISVNDLVRDEMQYLLNQDMGARDRQRLALHFDSVRDLEVHMACAGLADQHLSDLNSVNQNPDANDMLELVTQLHARLIALAFACDLRRTATLQIGSLLDGTQFTINGELQASWHHISHRKATDDALEEAPLIENGGDLHHEIDRIHGRLFRYLLDRLDEQVTVAGYNLLDDCVALWTNDLGTGPDHGHTKLPQIIAGSAGGFLRQGVFLDAGVGVPNNHFLSTLVNAVGIRQEDGSMVDDFGDPEIEKGIIPEMIA
ncbi:MAG: DUF1552 domain-containing protein, partial [Myxococcota bacterium]|nr:DUF1552 domain-containing protein [Myxococcota bacterium]